MWFTMIIMFTMIVTGYQYVTILHHFFQVAQVGENKDRTSGTLFWATRGLSDSLYILLKKKHGNGFHVFEDMCESPIPYHTFGLLRILPV